MNVPLQIHLIFLLVRSLDFLSCILLIFSNSDMHSSSVDFFQRLIGYLGLESYLRINGKSFSLVVFYLFAIVNLAFLFIFLVLMLWGRNARKSMIGKMMAACVYSHCFFLTQLFSTSFWIVCCSVIYCGDSIYKSHNCDDNYSPAWIILSSMTMFSHVVSVTLRVMFLNSSDIFSSHIVNGRSKLIILINELQFLVAGLFFSFLSTSVFFRTHFCLLILVMCIAKAYLDVEDIGYFNHSYNHYSQWIDGFNILLVTWPLANYHLISSPQSIQSFFNQILTCFLFGYSYSVFHRSITFGYLKVGNVGEEMTSKITKILIVCLTNIDNPMYSNALKKFASEHILTCYTTDCGCREAWKLEDPKHKLEEFVNAYLEVKSHEFEDSGKISQPSIFFKMKKSKQSLKFLLNMETLFKTEIDFTLLGAAFDQITELEVNLKIQDYLETDSELFILEKFFSFKKGQTLLLSMQKFIVEYVVFLEEIAENTQKIYKSFDSAMKLSKSLTNIYSEIINHLEEKRDSHILQIAFEFIRDLDFFSIEITKKVNELLSKHGKVIEDEMDLNLSKFHESLVIVFSLGSSTFSNITFASHSTPSFLNYSVEEMQTMNVTKLMPAVFAGQHNQLVMNYLDKKDEARREFRMSQVFMLDSDGFYVPMTLFGKVFPYFYSEARMIGTLTHTENPQFKGVLLLNNRNQILGMNRYVETSFGVAKASIKSDKSAEIGIDDLIEGFRSDATNPDRPQTALFHEISETQKRSVSMEFRLENFEAEKATKRINYFVTQKYKYFEQLKVVYLGLNEDEEARSMHEHELVFKNFQMLSSFRPTSSAKKRPQWQRELDSLCFSGRTVGVKKNLKNTKIQDQNLEMEEFQQLVSENKITSNRLSWLKFIFAGNFLITLAFFVCIFLICYFMVKTKTAQDRFNSQAKNLLDLHLSISNMLTNGFKLVVYMGYNVPVDLNILRKNTIEASGNINNMMTSLSSVIENYSDLFDNSLKTTRKSKECPYDMDVFIFISRLLSYARMAYETNLDNYDLDFVNSASQCILSVNLSGLLRACTFWNC